MTARFVTYFDTDESGNVTGDGLTAIVTGEGSGEDSSGLTLLTVFAPSSGPRFVAAQPKDSAANKAADGVFEEIANV